MNVLFHFLECFHQKGIVILQAGGWLCPGEMVRQSHLRWRHSGVLSSALGVAQAASDFYLIFSVFQGSCIHGI